jgi:2-polyprenyl-3-methyl-5-hydroxy-6-metoxy-1,4-benzoquinol methylase
MTVEFTAHNIRLDDGTLTKPDAGETMDKHAWFVSAKRLLDIVLPGDKSQYRLVDLGCLEGGFTVEFARMGFRALGLEVRESNIAACRFVKSRTNLPNLEFVRDDVLNVAKYGPFDVAFCCGLLYHLDRPKEFLQALSSVTSKVLILQTHFATEEETEKYALSSITENESVRGRWFVEFENDAQFRAREKLKWASWDNRRSFWIQREYLIQTIRDVGFDFVMEQFDGLGPNIAEAMTRGYYKTERRGWFVGIKAGHDAAPTRR